MTPTNSEDFDGTFLTFAPLSYTHSKVTKGTDAHLLAALIYCAEHSALPEMEPYSLQAILTLPETEIALVQWYAFHE